MVEKAIDCYRDRLLVPLDGSSDIVFTTETGLVIAKGFSRVVLGGRGPYVEFDDSHIVRQNCRIPQDQAWRLRRDFVYYLEYRTTDASRVKIYLQRRRVKYADYEVGKWYISPFDLFVDGVKSIRGEV